MSTIAGQQLQSVELHWPMWGGAFARVATSSGTVSPGPATLVIGDLSLVGAILPDRAGENAPASWSGIWASGDGWNIVLPRRDGYQNDGGVRLKTILADLAKDAGNLPMVQPADAAVGTSYARPLRSGDGRAWTGARELAALARGGYVPTPWWADEKNITRFGARPSGQVNTVGTSVRVISRDLTRGMRLFGVDSPKAFAPGLSIEGAVIWRMIVREKDGKSTTVETWTT